MVPQGSSLSTRATQAFLSTSPAGSRPIRHPPETLRELVPIEPHVSHRAASQKQGSSSEAQRGEEQLLPQPGHSAVLPERVVMYPL